jgi:GTP-binding protein HflX
MSADKVQERAYLIAVADPEAEKASAKDSLAELALLVDSAGAAVAGQTLQARRAPDPATYLGSGKVQECRQAMADLRCDFAVVDDELKPTQQRNLEQGLGRKVLDRTQLILDIFAQRARTREGKLQVELAQLSYLLPRLIGWGTVLSRLGGGIGTRGPGETKLETDRRRLRTRIGQLKRELAQVAATRGLHREARRSQRAPLAALAGYTNAGKSSLFNALTGAGVLVQDRLFATLDPTIRPVAFRSSVPGPGILLADTVGFIHKLPHGLVAAFRATLEEVREAGLKLLVLDATSPGLQAHKQTVEEVLDEIGSPEDVPTWLVLNKVDLLGVSRRRALAKTYPGAFLVSALTGEGMDKLKEALRDSLAPKGRLRVLEFPADEAGLLAKHYSRIRVLSQEWKANKLTVKAEVPREFKDLDGFVKRRRN